MTVNRSAPSATVTPILIYEDVVQAIDWLCRSFDFREHLRAERDGVVGHAQLLFGQGSVMLGRQGGPFRAPQRKNVSACVHVTVADVDKHFEHAKRSGARIVTSPVDMPFGERQYTAEDFAGHWWTFSQHLADVAPEEWGAALAIAK
jgi:uncharacterized glyoxalase superfamily protein PhnB